MRKVERELIKLCATSIQSNMNDGADTGIVGLSQPDHSALQATGIQGVYKGYTGGIQGVKALLGWRLGGGSGGQAERRAAGNDGIDAKCVTSKLIVASRV